MPRLFRLSSIPALLTVCTATARAAVEVGATAARRLVPYGGRAFTAHAVLIVLTLAIVASRQGVPEAQADMANGQLQLDRVAPSPERVTMPDSTGTLRGVITDSASREPVVGATISVNGSQRRAVTGPDGSYRIAGIPVGTAMLEVRRLGYLLSSQRVTVTAGAEMVVDFHLAPAPRTLDQIVTTATGDQARRQVGNAVATIRADSVVATAPVSTLSDVLTGRAAGVQVYQPGGLAGPSPQINIRGQNSISLANQPILIVDGVRVDNSAAPGMTAPVAAAAASGRLNDIAIGDIESIEIVKGPSAATLYGTDAANGVIVVRTKRGEGTGRRWNVSSEIGAIAIDRDRIGTTYYPWGHTPTGSVMRCTLLSAAAGACVQDSIAHFSPLLHPETTPFDRGWRSSHRLEASGGETIRYFLSGMLEHETGYLKMPDADRKLVEAQRGGRSISSEQLRPNGLDRYGLRANFTVPLAPTSDIAISTAFLQERFRIPAPSTLYPGFTSTGVRDETDGWRGNIRPGDDFMKRRHEDVTRFTGSLSGSWRPRAWLTGRFTAGTDFSSSYLDELARAGEGLRPATALGARNNTKLNTSIQTLDANLTATNDLTRSVNARTSFGAQYTRRLAIGNTAAAQQLPPGGQTVAGGAQLIARESTAETVVAGAYGETTLGVRDRLYLTGALRVDGASTFGAGFRAAIYPKASLSWMLSEEPFWPTLPVLASLRLRAAYGQSGVQPAPTAALASELVRTAFVDGVTTPGAGLGAIGNRDLRPERQREFEIGLDATLIKNRLEAELTYYDKHSTDALVNLPLPASFGGGTQWQNVGAVRNWGYEALLRATLLSRRALQWTVELNGSVNSNRVLAIGPGITVRLVPGGPAIVQGEPLFSYYEFPILGYADSNGDGRLDASEITVDSVRAFAGQAYPRLQATVTSRLGLFENRLLVSASLDRRAGFRILNGTESARCYFDSCLGIADPRAPLAEQAAAIASRTASLNSTEWGFIEDGAFTRLREVSLTYVLPQQIIARLGSRNGSITLAGRNLALWTRYSGADPEVSRFFGRPDLGAFSDQGSIPPPQTFIARVTIGF